MMRWFKRDEPPVIVWDATNTRKVRAHGLEPSEVESVFLDPNLYVRVQGRKDSKGPRMSRRAKKQAQRDNKDQITRYLVIGKSSSSRFLVVPVDEIIKRKTNKGITSSVLFLRPVTAYYANDIMVRLYLQS
jgi:uncharacterized DUF497 family protein